MSGPSASQPGAQEAAESPEFDFGPFQAKIQKLWGDFIGLQSGGCQEVEARRPQAEAKLDEIIRLSAETLIASGGEIVEPYNILEATKSKGVFRALGRAIREASKANPTYLMPAQYDEIIFARRIAAEAVKILLARQKASEQPAPGPEVAEVTDATKEGAGDATQ